MRSSGNISVPPSYVEHRAEPVRDAPVTALQAFRGLSYDHAESIISKHPLHSTRGRIIKAREAVDTPMALYDEKQFKP